MTADPVPTVPVRSIGTFGATAIIVGFVIGVSVFVLPGVIAADVGPAVVIVYLIASLLGFLACVVAAQLGCAYATNAASFVAVADRLGEVWGFVLVWIIVGSSAVGVGLLAHGLAAYLRTLVAVDGTLIAASSVLLSAAANLFGARTGARLQALLVAAFLTVLLIFVGAGLGHLQPSLLIPVAPAGWSVVLLSVIPAYFSYAGFFVVIELAGEVRSPERTLPRALLVSFLLVLVIYALVSVVLVGLLPWQSLRGDPAPVITAAHTVLPPAVVSVMAVTAVAAGASSINGILLGYSRDIQALAQRGLLPRWMLLHHNSMDQSSAGVLSVAVLALAAVVVSESIAVLATLAVLGILSAQVFLGLALLRRGGATSPARTQRPGGLLDRRVGVVAAWLLVGVSVGAAAAVVLGQPMQLLVMVLYVGLGVAVYALARRFRD